MKKEIMECPCCHVKSVVYRHGLTRVIIKGLRALHNAGGSAKLNELGLSNSEFNNFQKLRYFGLAVMDGNHKWQITYKGIGFLTGMTPVFEYVTTLNGAVRTYSPKDVFIHQVKNAVEYKIEWQEQARPTLFD